MSYTCGECGKSAGYLGCLDCSQEARIAFAETKADGILEDITKDENHCLIRDLLVNHFLKEVTR